MATTQLKHLFGVYSVIEFGAVGDGITNDTEALQRTIDACTKAGGGQVIVPGGTYLTGTIYLRDNIELHLSAGATLLGSPNRIDYNDDDAYPEFRPWSIEHVTAAHLIIGYRLNNISITGSGTIDGNSYAFFAGLEPPADKFTNYRSSTWNASMHDWRPSQMIWLCRCNNVVVKDIRLRNSTYWSFLLYGCENVQIRGLNINNPPSTPNGDGIDVDCSRNVTISDCIIITSDDCITLRGFSELLGEDIACEHVIVSNCLLSTPANCIRVGVGDGEIRNCRFNNLQLINSRVGINMVSNYPNVGKRGTLIENIAFNNITIDAILALQALHGEGTQADAGFRNISFTNIEAQITAGAYIGGNADNYAENFTFRDWNLYVHDEIISPKSIEFLIFPKPINGCTGKGAARILPAALYARYVNGLQAHNIRVHWDKGLQRVWLNTLLFESCHNVEREN